MPRRARADDRSTSGPARGGAVTIAGDLSRCAARPRAAPRAPGERHCGTCRGAFRRVRRQVEHRDPRRILAHPLADGDACRRSDALLAHHEAQQASVPDHREVAHRLPAGADWPNRRAAAGRAAAPPQITRDLAGLVSPVDLGTLGHRLARDPGVFGLEPMRDRHALERHGEQVLARALRQRRAPAPGGHRAVLVLHTHNTPEHGRYGCSEPLERAAAVSPANRVGGPICRRRNYWPVSCGF